MISLISIFFPILVGGVLCFKPLEDCKKVHQVTLVTMIFTLIVVFIGNFSMLDSSAQLLQLVYNVSISFKVDTLAVFFTTIAVVIWLLVGIYSFDYMSHYKNESRYFAFYLISLGMLLGVFYAENLVTLYAFFEGLSLSAYMLVIHEGTQKAHLAGRKFIYYSIFGASLGLIAIIYSYAYMPDVSFVAGGILSLESINDLPGWQLVSFLAIVGFGCKAGLFPLHAWLAAAHPVAPAPASAVLSGLVTKAGVVAIIRLIFYYFGIELFVGSWVQSSLIGLCLLTIFMGSMLAVREKILKKRLAYSSVSQVSYVLLGLFLMNEIGFVGALLQVLFHASAKCLLFLVAGSVIYQTHHTHVDDLIGLGYRHKWIFILLLIGGLSLVGIPLTGGFVSKWYLAQGAFSSSYGLISVTIIMLSALLTAMYLFTPVTNAFFVPTEKIVKGSQKLCKRMLYPMLCLALIVIVLGIYPQPIIAFLNEIAMSLGM